MRKIVIGAVACLALAGCSYQLNLQQRGGPVTGKGVAHENDSSVEITLGDKLYRGQYVFASGDSVGSMFGTAGKGKSFAGFGSSSGVGGGNLMARAADGSGLRCQFQFSTTNSQGFGECQDDTGATYDLQIRM